MSQGIFSRVDAYLAYALREIDTYPAPQSRLDKSLIELAETVRLGGASPDVIRQAVNDYLAANPPAGMTDEEIADSVNDSIANGDIQVGTVLTADQINNINDVPALAEEISNNKITGAAIVNDELVISLGDGSSINAGDVVSDPYVPVVGTVVSVPSTEPAKVTIVNDADTNESTFNFEIPKGNDGSSPTITQVVDENVLTHALTYDPLTSNEFYAFNCSGLPNTMRYGYCRVNVSQDPLYRDITFKCPTSGRIYVNTIGADPDDPTVLGSWSGWHVSLLEEDVKEYTEDDILEMLNLSEVELDILSNLIDDDNISLSKTFSSSKIFQGLQEMLEEGKRFTLSAVATKIGASYKTVTSISQMVDTNYIYLLGASTGYDMYIVDDGGRAVQIGDTQIDLSDYYNKTQVDDKFVTKADADGKYITIAAVDNKVDKDKIATVLDDTVTNEQIPGAKVVVDELNTKANDSEVVKKTDIATTLDSTSTDDEVTSAKAVYDNAIKDKRLKTYTSFEQLGISIANLSSSSLSDIGTRMEEGSSFNVLIRSDVKDIAYNAGIIPINDVGILSCIRLVGRFKVTFSHDKGGTGRNISEFMTFSHNISTQSTFVWKKVCTTTVADVPFTELTVNNWANGSVAYTVENGICYIWICGLESSTMSQSSQTIVSNLPHPKRGGLWCNIVSSDCTKGGLLVTVSPDGKLENYSGLNNTTYFGTFSYPVAE